MTVNAEQPSDRVSSTVRYALNGRVAMMFIDNPPVNGLGDTVRAGLYAGLERRIQCFIT